jgi:hypothetical protein
VAVSAVRSVAVSTVRSVAVTAVVCQNTRIMPSNAT